MSASTALQSTLEELEHVESPPVAPISIESRRFESPLVEPRRVRWTREQYHQLGELGWFQNKRVQLIDGEFIEMSPMARPHALSLWKTTKKLESIFQNGFFGQTQMPLPVSPTSEPEPDVAVFPGQPQDYPHDNPSKAVLVVEVSDTTLRYDRSQKASLYASAHIPVPEYWVVDLVQNQLIVHRRPQAMEDQPFGFGYASIEVLSRDMTVEPSAAPQNKIVVSELLL